MPRGPPGPPGGCAKATGTVAVNARTARVVRIVVVALLFIVAGSLLSAAIVRFAAAFPHGSAASEDIVGVARAPVLKRRKTVCKCCKRVAGAAISARQNLSKPCKAHGPLRSRVLH